MSKDHRCVSVIYCDDIRMEVSQKLMLIGIYQHQLIINTLPAILPKLCLYVTASTPVSQPFEAFSLVVYKNEEEIHRLVVEDVAEEQLMATKNRLENEDEDGDEPRVYSSNFAIVLSPFQIEKECRIRVQIETEVGLLKATGLSIIKGETPNLGIH